MIPLAFSPEPVLTYQKQLEYDTASEKEKNHEGHNQRMPDGILRGLEINITRDDTVEVAPADHKTDDDAALIHAFDVVRDPGNGVCDTGVDTESTEEGAGIFDAWLLGAEEHGEAGYAEEGDANVTETSLTGAIGNISNGDSKYSGCRVRGDTEQLGSGGGVPEFRDNGRQEEREGI